MTTPSDAILLKRRDRRRAAERAGSVMLPWMPGRVVGTDMTPGAWMILRLEIDLARRRDGESILRAYSLPSRFDRFVRVRFTCAPHGRAARNVREPAS